MSVAIVICISKDLDMALEKFISTKLFGDAHRKVIHCKFAATHPSLHNLLLVMKCLKWSIQIIFAANRCEKFIEKTIIKKNRNIFIYSIEHSTLNKSYKLYMIRKYKWTEMFNMITFYFHQLKTKWKN